ncbi:MAG: EamA family transporter [Thomasclavelia ramosa]
MIFQQCYGSFILFSGIGFALIQLIYFKAVHEIGSVKTSFLLGLNPVFTYIGALFLGENLIYISLSLW